MSNKRRCRVARDIRNGSKPARCRRCDQRLTTKSNGQGFVLIVCPACGWEPARQPVPRDARPFDADLMYATQLACTMTTDPDELEQARKISHDMLIEKLGPVPRGPVEWRWWSGPERFDVLDGMEAGASAEPAPSGFTRQYADARAWCEQYPDGFLVVALAEVSEPARLVTGDDDGG